VQSARLERKGEISVGVVNERAQPLGPAGP
jgi:hypothetical protein